LPTRVFDDGRRTWIEFSEKANAADLPPVFAITGEGAELVNYRVQTLASGQRYMIDRVFDRAELRLGAKSPVIVRIDRQTPKSRARS
jgi:type IV secretion system protein TrbG